MNGRAYDYNLGRFLSVDPFIQAPGNSQSMNPYSYIMNNPLSGTDPSGYKSRPSAGSTTIWDRNWGNVLSLAIETRNGERITVQITRGELERGEISQLENLKLDDLDNILIVETPNVTKRSQTGSTNTKAPRKGGQITNAVYDNSVTVNTLESLEMDWRDLLISEDITSIDWIQGQDKILAARFSKRRLESAEWRVQAQLNNMRMKNNDLQKAGGTVMAGAIALPLVTAYGSPYFSGLVSFLNSQTPMQAFITSGTGGGFVSVGLYGYSADMSNRDTTLQGYVSAFGIGFMASGLQGWGTAMSGSYSFVSIENLVWHTNAVALSMPLEYLNSLFNTKEKE